MNDLAATPLFKKLNLGAHREIAVFDAPDSFESELKQLKGVKVARDPKAKSIAFGLAFAITQAQLDRASKIFAAASEGDAVIWFAYPKGTSKRYKCEFNRDSGWSVIRDAGFESVRMVAIDEDWSALRFRRVEYMKSGVNSSPSKKR
ncbi:MAG TPA: hypothetical protein VHS76_07595 [Steroidobacteraceae bacterium]|jgi:hypothetical protein|nr:hypothetical protein [Steroidobacteraceae bacterium]